MESMNLKKRVVACIICLISLISLPVYAEDDPLTYSLSFTDAELDDLLAPIALYPDPLLAQMLPASTYPTEIIDADEWLRSGGAVSDIDDQNWDESVKAMARYPDVLRMMADNMDWTANLGDAFLNQPEGVSKSIQRLRRQARDLGNLTSNDKQSVDIIEEGNIEIIPTQPRYIYVPVYDPAVVFFSRPLLGIPPFVVFGPPLLLGGWLIMDFNWGHHEVIYHGWNRPGWVNHARPYIHVTNVYVNRSRPAIHQRWRHDASHGDPARYLMTRPSGPKADRYSRIGEVRGKTAAQPKPAGRLFDSKSGAYSYSNRGKESRGIVKQQPSPAVIPGTGTGQRRAMPTPRVSGRPAASAPSVQQQVQQTTPQRPAMAGSDRKQSGGSGVARETQQTTKRPSTAFGGYRGADEAKAQSMRGQTSRQSSAGGAPSASHPPSRGNAPGTAGHSSEGKQRR